jgi:hypothetical protein
MKMRAIKNKSTGAYVLLSMIAISMSFTRAHAQVSYSFNTCGATGMNGPNQGQVNTSYNSTNLSGSVTIVNPGIQQFTIPTTGNYGFTVAGSAGGGNISATGCRGRIVQGDVFLTAGTVLKILVGQKGDLVNGSSGGGGGSYVATLANVPIIVGGGGGGYLGQLGSALPVTDASYGNAGNPASDGTGPGGSGGGGGSGTNGGWGGGGGGFTGNGTQGSACANTGGISFINGGTGGATCNNTNGGFGGGGGTHGNTGGGGGGGGYSGGGGSSQNVSPAGGGGGGSFQAANMTNTADLGYNLAQGYVIIRRLCNVSLNASNNPICIGQSVTLSTDAASGITWSGSPSTGNSIVVSPNVTTTYSVTGTSTANCVAGSFITVVVNPLPVLNTVVTPSTLCVGKTATIVAYGANTYTWNNGPTGSSLLVTPGVNTVYNLSGESQAGCLNSATVSVNVSTNSLTVSSAASLCKGSALTLTASGAVTYTWSNGANFASIPVSPTSNTTYTVDGTDMFDCKISSMVPVTVNNPPTVTANASKANVCRNEPVTLSASGTANTYTWSNSTTGPVATIINQVDVVYSFTVTGEDNNGCTATAIVTVSVNKCVGINEFGKAGLEARVFPNPVGSMLTVELNNSSAKFIEVTDLSGRLILSKSGDSQAMDLDVSSLADGVYYIKLRSDDMTEIFKIVKANQ